MTITASMVKELRERTGAGMMECKRALTETGGDMETAVETLRKKGSAAADKKASRIAAEGAIVIRQVDGSRSACIVEINCETDFVSRDDSFTAFASQVADIVLEDRPETTEALAGLDFADRKSVEQARKDLVAKIGENISIRRFNLIDAPEGESVAGYLHGNRIGVLVSGRGDPAVTRDIAMHVAASQPITISAAELPEELIEKEKEIFRAQAQATGKPAEIIEKMIDGRIRKFMKENTLMGQPFVKNPDLTVEQHLAGNNASISRMVRYQVGEGIEKRQDDFAAEVMAQAKGV